MKAKESILRNFLRLLRPKHLIEIKKSVVLATFMQKAIVSKKWTAMSNF